MYVREIQLVQPHGPYRVIGFSIGGLIAYEVARQLLHKGEEVGYLALIDPSMPSVAAPTSDWAANRGRWAMDTVFKSGQPFRGLGVVLKHVYTSTTMRAKTNLEKMKVRLYTVFGMELPVELRRARSDKAIKMSVRGFEYQPIETSGSIYTVSRPEQGAETKEAFWAGVFLKGSRVHWVDSAKTHMEFMHDENIALVVRDIVQEIDAASTASTSN